METNKFSIIQNPVVAICPCKECPLLIEAHVDLGFQRCYFQKPLAPLIAYSLWRCCCFCSYLIFLQDFSMAGIIEFFFLIPFIFLAIGGRPRPPLVPPKSVFDLTNTRLRGLPNYFDAQINLGFGEGLGKYILCSSKRRV
jgi:hypothetical protein